MNQGDFIFLTGATGHTGSYLARRLLAEGRTLRCLVHTAEHARHLPADERLRVVPGDIEQPEPWQGELAGAAALVHMAHVGFAPMAIAACRAAGVRRLVSLSSTRRFTKFPEETARLVIAGEAALEASGLDFTILRPSMIFGGPRDNNLEKVVRWLGRHRWMPLVAGGRNLVQPIFVLDLVEAIVAALTRPGSIGRALTLAGPEALTQRELIEQIARAMGRPLHWVPVPMAAALTAGWLLEQLQHRPLATRDQFRRMLEDKTFDISEAKTVLAWTPRPFQEAIQLKLARQINDSLPS